MIAAARGHVERPEDFLVLDVASGDRQHLRAKAEFAELAGERIIAKFVAVGGHGGFVAPQEGCVDDAAAGDGHQPDGAVFVLHRELAFGAGRDEVHLARRQVRDVGTAPSQAVTFLGLLAPKLDVKLIHLVAEAEVDVHAVRAGQSEAQLFGRDANFIVINGEARG